MNLDRTGPGGRFRREEALPELNWLTERIIGGIFRVHSALGPGFLEQVYENALVMDLVKRGLEVERQVRFTVMYDREPVGTYIADLVVAGRVIVEIKACETLKTVHRAQCLNYLRAANLPLALLVNFSSLRAEIRRIIR
jgi:GxxExxY protein